MAASRPSITDIKLLFARSGNRCAFPKCRAPLALNGTLTGEVCHIKGARPGSARYDSNQTEEERHAYTNLVLMCPTHHTVIDDDEEAYTIERLGKIKTVHESQSTPIPDAEAESVAVSFMQSTVNIGQNGGLAASTVNANNINLHGPIPTNHITHQCQIQAVENLWATIQRFRNDFANVIVVNTMLTDQEIDDYFKNGSHSHFLDCVREYEVMDHAIRKLTSSGAEDATKERPFISPRLWSIYYVIRGIYGRTGLLVTNSFKERRFISWRQDSGCDQLLRAVLPAQAVDDAKGQQFGGLQSAIDYLESQFLAEAGMNRPHS